MKSCSNTGLHDLADLSRGFNNQIIGVLFYFSYFIELVESSYFENSSQDVKLVLHSELNSRVVE